jgi:hypothetical protein
MRSRRRYIIISIILLVLVGRTCLHYINPIKSFPIEGKLVFTDKYDPDAKVCIPAAYTGTNGKIEGQYRINGITKGGKGLKERVSLHPTKGIVISTQWQSANGFQQHVLVKDGKVRNFRDKRRFRRRALCNDASNPDSLFIIESRCRMTMNEFADVLLNHSTNAVNLDMGRWGYGWCGTRKLSLWAWPFKKWQTNWIVVK